MFDSETLKKFEFLSLASTRNFVGETSGTRRNSKTGGGVEFADYRDYAFGDDLRNLDWNVYARFDALCIKRFQEEGDAPVCCMVDVSRSMGANSKAPKFEYAKNVAGALAYISLAAFDTVAAFGLTNRANAFMAPVRGREQFLNVAKFLDALEIADGQTDLTGAVEDALRKLVKPGLAVIISDCFDQKGLDVALEKLLARRFDPIVLQICAPEEANPRETGDFEFVDSETKARRKLTIDEGTLRRYVRRFREFQDATRESCVRRGVRYYSTLTDVPFETFLLQVARDIKSGR